MRLDPARLRPDPSLEIADATSFACYLEPLTDLFSPVLLSHAAVERMASHAFLLPVTFDHQLFGLECRLGFDGPNTDLLVCASAATGRPGLLQTVRRAQSLGVTGWQALERFAVAWADERLGLHDAVDDVWLEFDADHYGSCAPSVFFSPESPDPRAPALRSASTRNLEELLWNVLELLAADELDRATRATVGACVARKPPQARLFQVGMMLGRAPPTVRLCLSGLDLTAIRSYLAAIDWPGKLSTALAIVEPYAALADRCVLQIDAGAAVGPRFGVELYLGATDEWLGADRWAPLLDALAETRLCTPAKRAALDASIREVDQLESPASWPPGLLAASSLARARFVSTAGSRLHHVKLSVTAAGLVDAKAYVAVEYGWRWL